jgi:hypothetical protein
VLLDVRAKQKSNSLPEKLAGIMSQGREIHLRSLGVDAVSRRDRNRALTGNAFKHLHGLVVNPNLFTRHYGLGPGFDLNLEYSRP